MDGEQRSDDDVAIDLREPVDRGMRWPSGVQGGHNQPQMKQPRRRLHSSTARGVAVSDAATGCVVPMLAATLGLRHLFCAPYSQCACGQFRVLWCRGCTLRCGGKLAAGRLARGNSMMAIRPASVVGCAPLRKCYYSVRLNDNRLVICGRSRTSG